MNYMLKYTLLVCMLTVGSVELMTLHPTNTQTAPLLSYRQKLETHVERFDTSGRSLVASMLDLAYEYEIPIAIEYLDRDAVFRPLALVFHDQSISEIFVGITRQMPEYQIAFTPGIVELYSPKAREDRTNVLSKLIKDFAVTEVDTHKADSELFCMLTREFLPASPCVGSVALGQWGQLKVTVQMENAKVYEILNAIVAENGKALWTVMAPPEKLTEIPAGGLWHIYPLEKPFREGALDKLKQMW